MTTIDELKRELLQTYFDIHPRDRIYARWHISQESWDSLRQTDLAIEPPRMACGLPVDIRPGPVELVVQRPPRRSAVTTPPQYPTCPTCGHAARHTDTNVRRCDECGGPCVTEEGWRTFGISRPWPGRKEQT